jgi:hypothetical protein
MENDLVSIYENSYLRGGIIEEKAVVEQDEDEDADAKPTFKKTVKKSKSSMKKSKNDIGGITYDSVNKENLFDKILREMDEMGGSAGEVGDTEDVYDPDSQFAGEGDEEMISLSELRNMTLAEIAELLQGEVGEYSDEDPYADETEDEIPTESYGFLSDAGNHKGLQGTYDGKAKPQSKSTRVKDNGDADFGSQDTGYDPDDTEGSEGEHNGMQGTYDGKARPQPKSPRVKDNGDADFKHNTTDYKLSSVKKEKNYF